MNESINIVERYIIESINNEKLFINQIAKKTKLELNYIYNILKSLIERKILASQDERYFLNPNLEKEQLIQIQSKENKYYEISEILSACLRENLFNENPLINFKFKKVFLNEKEEKIFSGLLYNLEAFLNSIPKREQIISEQKIIFWGGGSYENITTSALNY